MSDNLTDSQRNLLAAMKREMVAVGDDVKAEIAKLREEQRARHEAGIHQAVNEQQIKYAKLKQTVRRIAGSLLALIGGDD